MILLLVVLLIDCLIISWYVLEKRRKERENRTKAYKTINTIRILLDKQIEYMDDNLNPYLQKEISKYIKDFLLSELANQRFTPNGLDYAHCLIVKEIPEIMKYYPLSCVSYGKDELNEDQE